MTRSISIEGALELSKRGVYVVHNPHTRRVTGAMEPELHDLSIVGDVDPFAAVVESGYSPADDERDFAEEEWQRRNAEEEHAAELEDELRERLPRPHEPMRELTARKRSPLVRELGSYRGGYSMRVLVVTLAALALLLPATASAVTELPSAGGDGGAIVIADPCAKKYPPAETFTDRLGRTFPRHPVMLAYVRCVRSLSR